MLENVIYFEPKRHGYDIYIGKKGTKEIDFIATRLNEQIYVQVTRQLPEYSEREEANLLEIPDNYPKYIIILDEFSSSNINSIKIVHLAEFLLMETY